MCGTHSFPAWASVTWRARRAVWSETVGASLQKARLERLVYSPYLTCQIRFFSLVSKAARGRWHAVSCQLAGRLHLRSSCFLPSPLIYARVTQSALQASNCFYLVRTDCDSGFTQVIYPHQTAPPPPPPLVRSQLCVCVGISTTSCALIPSPGDRANLSGETAA